jgi:hypothetical protein
MLVNVQAITGEQGTGFEKRGSKGPFECGNCEYFKGSNACHQEDMKRYSKQPKWPDGTVKVDSADCCEYVERIGKFWTSNGM